MTLNNLLSSPLGNNDLQRCETSQHVIEMSSHILRDCSSERQMTRWRGFYTLSLWVKLVGQIESPRVAGKAKGLCCERKQRAGNQLAESQQSGSKGLKATSGKDFKEPTLGLLPVLTAPPPTSLAHLQSILIACCMLCPSLENLVKARTLLHSV